MALVALHTAASGMSAQNKNIDIIANNIANVNTTAFKNVRGNFEDLFYQTVRRAGATDANGIEDPTGFQVGLGTVLRSTQRDFRQGSIVTTGQQFDIAIEGPGFFQITVPTGLASNDVAYTRDGTFTLNSNGQLVTRQGYLLRDNITISNDATSVTILTDGTVIEFTPGNPGGTTVGNIELARFVNPAGLSALGENLYEETDASNTPITGTPASGEFGRLRQGAVESANVNVVSEIVDLIQTQRAFEFNAQTIRAADEMLQLIGNLRRM